MASQVSFLERLSLSLSNLAFFAAIGGLFSVAKTGFIKYPM